MIHIAAIEFN